MNKKRYTKGQMRRAILASYGTLSSAAKKLKPPCSYETVRVYCERYPDLKELLCAQKDHTTECVTDVRVKHALKGSGYHADIYLRTKDGLKLKHEVAGRDGGPIEVRVIKFGDTEVEPENG